MSSEFQTFLRRNGIRHITSAPYHPASNGLAERAVQTFKSALQKASDGDLETQLSRFLFKYRNTPHTTTGTTPAELLMGWTPRTHLSLIYPNLASKVQRQQEKHKAEHDKHAKEREINIEDPVFVRDFTAQTLKWIPGVVLEEKGPLLFFVQLPDGRIVRRHIDHIRTRTVEVEDTPTVQEDDILPPVAITPSSGGDTQPQVSPTAAPPRRSTRMSQPPDQLSS